MDKVARSIEKDFVVLSPKKTAFIEHFDESLYERLYKNYNGFNGHELISCYQFSEDWKSWEIHPNGDEIVILLSGEATFVFQKDDSEETVHLDTVGGYVLVPKGIWHTVRTNLNTKMLFITPGQGTQHRPI